MPAGNVIYAVLGLGIFGGYTALDFTACGGGKSGDDPRLAAGIFLKESSDIHASFCSGSGARAK